MIRHSVQDLRDAVFDVSFMNMLIRGKFQRAMMRQLAAMAIVFSVIILIVLVFLFRVMYDSSNDEDWASFQNQSSIIDISYNIMSRVPKQLDASLMSSYSNAVEAGLPGKAQLYARSLYDDIREIGASSPGSLPYSIAVIDRDSSLVVSDNGTCNIDYFLNNESGFADDMKKEALLALSSNKQSFFPVYEDGNLEELSVLIPLDESIMCFLRIYVSSFLQLSEDEHAFLYFADGSMIPYIEDDVWTIRDERRYEKLLTGRSCTYQAYFERGNAFFEFVPALFVSFAALFLVSAFFIMHNMKRLYVPLAEAISEDGDIPFDEIAAVADNRNRVMHLTHEVENLIQRHNSDEKVMHYRFLLDGIIPAGNEDPESCFVVALVSYEFSDVAEEQSYLRMYIESSSSVSDDIVIVPYGFVRFAIVMRQYSEEQAFSVIQNILSREGGDSAKAAISTAVQGTCRLSEALHQCQGMLAWYSDIDPHRIVTPSFIPTKNVPSYSYSTVDEMRLIKSTIQAKDDAGAFFSELMEKNVGNEHRRAFRMAFCISMLCTLQRLSTELDLDDHIFIEIHQLFNEKNVDILAERINELYSQISLKAGEKAAGEADELLLKMKEYIHQNYMKDIGLQNMADYFNITPKYCGLLFLKLSNENFRNYLNRYRIDRAKEMLASDPDMRIQDLAGVVGFNSSNTFIRVFDKYVGCSPKIYAMQIIEENAQNDD